jgi:hypothetical protein
MADKNRSLNPALLAFVSILFFYVPAFALMVGLSTEKLTHDAGLIVTGYVEDTVSQWTADKKSIITTAVVAVEQCIKGACTQKQIQVMQMGGQMGDLVMAVSDEVLLKKGERVLLFLSPEHELSGGSACKIVGRAQGKYSIGEDGIARKGGFSVGAVNDQKDNNIQVDKLTEKIRRYVDEK